MKVNGIQNKPNLRSVKSVEKQNIPSFQGEKSEEKGISQAAVKTLRALVLSSMIGAAALGGQSCKKVDDIHIDPPQEQPVDTTTHSTDTTEIPVDTLEIPVDTTEIPVDTIIPVEPRPLLVINNPIPIDGLFIVLDDKSMGPYENINGGKVDNETLNTYKLNSSYVEGNVDIEIDHNDEIKYYPLFLEDKKLKINLPGTEKSSSSQAQEDLGIGVFSIKDSEVTIDNFYSNNATLGLAPLGNGDKKSEMEELPDETKDGKLYIVLKDAKDNNIYKLHIGSDSLSDSEVSDIKAEVLEDNVVNKNFGG